MLENAAQLNLLELSDLASCGFWVFKEEQVKSRSNLIHKVY